MSLRFSVLCHARMPLLVRALIILLMNVWIRAPAALSRSLLQSAESCRHIQRSSWSFATTSSSSFAGCISKIWLQRLGRTDDRSLPNYLRTRRPSTIKLQSAHWRPSSTSWTRPVLTVCRWSSDFFRTLWKSHCAEMTLPGSCPLEANGGPPNSSLCSACVDWFSELSARAWPVFTWRRLWPALSTIEPCRCGSIPRLWLCFHWFQRMTWAAFRIGMPTISSSPARTTPSCMISNQRMRSLTRMCHHHRILGQAPPLMDLGRTKRWWRFRFPPSRRRHARPRRHRLRAGTTRGLHPDASRYSATGNVAFLEHGKLF